MIADLENLPVRQVFVVVYTEKLSMAGSAGMIEMIEMIEVIEVIEVHISVRII